VKQALEWRAQGHHDYDIEVDGGLDAHTIIEAVQAGAEVIVAGTSVFGKPGAPTDLRATVKALRDSAAQAFHPASSS
jgi:ribulose-phosphate 3-epimerase